MSSFPRADDFIPVFGRDFVPTGPNDFIFNHDIEDSLSAIEVPLPDKISPSKNFHNTRPLSYSNRKYSFSTKYEKFHVTPHHRAGYNKIYNFRRSRSFFFELVDLISDTNQIELKIYTNDYHMSSIPIQHTSTSRLPNIKFQISKLLTHFFSTQKVIPRRLQPKFFGLIRKKLLERFDFIKSRVQKNDLTNHMTKTFFNFSYKKYRFYFGIYLPCNHVCTNDRFNTAAQVCTTPVPFTMSKHRSACILHHKKLVLYTTPKDEKSPYNNDCRNPKDFHADLLHRRWASKRIYNHFSQRLGISFDTKYHAYGLNNVVKKGSDCIYGKVYFNFKHRHSTSLRTEKRQHARFESLRRRVFNSSNLPPNANRDSQFLAAKRKCFLFDAEQHICKRLKHLCYKKKFITPLQSYYNFSLPFPDQDIGIIPVHPVKDNNVPTDESIVSTDAILDKVPPHLIPLIPDDPFYAGGLLNQPSSNKIKNKKLQPLVVGSDAWLAHMEEIYNKHESTKRHNEKILAYSIKWDTDSDRAEYRECLLDNVMTYTDVFHDYEVKKLEIASRPPPLPVPKNTKKGKQKKKNKQADNASTSTSTPDIKTDKEILEDLDDLVRYYEDHPYMTRRQARLYEPDTMVMDANLTKRCADINGNLDSHYGFHITKKVCIALDRLGSDTSSPNDTK
ncbi:hypothetical protein RhiirA4_509744 [Rhizophagus irregularis]|uniref:DUF8211 domain-containing protein n=1 Tax=Rhizophagus irregularis TaxID=588596 RepID=A0A2I1HEV6_9GLOM|nr:hypothetical protein RhiirA4_475983 [Rhizophagus irregularis]PKY57360.1 hypothetical protein RhiirA4_509744 [Rhizophagus irregularis]